MKKIDPLLKDISKTGASMREVKEKVKKSICIKATCQTLFDANRMRSFLLAAAMHSVQNQKLSNFHKHQGEGFRAVNAS